MKFNHLHPHPSPRYDSIEGDDLAEPHGAEGPRGPGGRRRGRGGPPGSGRRGRGGPPGLHRGHPGHHEHRPPDAATRRARLESHQRDLEQELADVAERIRRLDDES